MAVNKKKLQLFAPGSWRELNQAQLKYVMSLIAFGFNFDQIKTYCLVRWNDIEIVEHEGRNYVLKHHGNFYYCSAMIIQSATDELAFMEEIPAYPVCLKRIGRHKALPETFEDVPFKKYLICDNLYQGYLYTKREDLLDEMAKVLYQSDKVTCKDYERMAVFYWWSSLKNYFAREFPYFFKPSGGTPQDIGKAVKNAMNTQIRALTKGDVTKEKEIFATDTLRALNELNALALEYEELERKYPQKK